LVLESALGTWMTKVHPKIFERIATPEKEAPFIILLKDSVNIQDLNRNITNNAERPFIVYNTLSQKAKISQAPLIRDLKKMGLQFRSYWIVNMISTTGNFSVVRDIASREDVLLLESNHEVKVPLEGPDAVSISAPSVPEWNINMVRAPAVWALGIAGQGFTVGNADTGVHYSHPALINKYRGTVAGGPVHDFNWWDSVHSGGGGNCGVESQVPCDDNGHGTHTTGTAVGEAGANQIGVAPVAKFIACRNMNVGFGTPTTYIECLQFFIAPTDLNGNGANPALAPHAVGNSYGCPPSEGCSPNSLLQAIQAVKTAGIFMAVSAGNAGPSCGSVNDPPAIYDDVFSVGALAQSRAIASYSSRGPVNVDGTGNPKPDISAPGTSVRSCVPNTGYASYSGTSMASPHVAGAVALIWQAHSSLLRNVAATEQHIEQTADKTNMGSTVCGGNAARDNVFGYGLIDIYEAVTTAPSMKRK